MAESRKIQEKADQRAAALRDNLKKRKAFMKETRTEKPKVEKGEGDDAKS